MKLAARIGAAAGAVLLLAACATPAPAEKETAQRGTPAAGKAAQPEHPVKATPPAAATAAKPIVATPVAPPPGAAKVATVQALVAAESTFDLGGVDRGATAKHTFIVKNTSKKEMKINAKPG